MTKDRIVEFDALIKQREDLSEQLQTASSFSRDIFETAVGRAEQKLAELAAQPEVRDHLLQVGAPLFKGLEELDRLQALGNGLADEEVANR